MPYAAALLPVSLTPTLAGVAGVVYFAAALVLSLVLLGLAVRFAATRTESSARALFFGSIIYLPLIWIVMIGNRAVAIAAKPFRAARRAGPRAALLNE